MPEEVTTQPEPELTVTGWLKSTHSGADGCTELGLASDGRIAVRNSKHPEAATVFFTRAQIDDFLERADFGEFDHLR